MVADDPRYTFHPLERRGVLLGLDARQLLVIGAAALMAFVAHAAVSGSAGVVLGIVVLAAGVTSAVWTRDGSNVAAWTVLGAGWLARRPSQPRLDDSPLDGQPRSAVPIPQHGRSRVSGPSRPTRPLSPLGIEVVDSQTSAHDSSVGMIRDGRAGTWAAVLPVRGCSLSLLDPVEQAQKLEGWRRVLGATARPDTPVARLQWVQRSGAGPTTNRELEPAGWATAAGGTTVDMAARASYHGLIEAAGPDITCHEAWLVLVVGSRTSRGRGPGPDRSTPALERELRFLDGQLRAADLEPGRPLDGSELRRLLGSSRARTSGGPMASEESWAAHRTDGEWHVTYWVAEWPRVDVRPDFLGPLLLCQARTAVSVIMAPIPADRALRSVRSARTADLADAELRARAGFLPSARRERERDGVTRREEELADGHHDFRFSGYVTVSAPSREELVGACGEVEHAAQASRLELRRLFGRQAEAYTWTLPLGRGLR